MTLVGYGAGLHLGGVQWAILGGLVATLSMILPAMSLTYLITLFWQKAEESRWRIAVEKGLPPLTVGLIMATALVMSRAADHDWRDYLMTAACTVIFVRTSLNPLYLVAAAGLPDALVALHSGAGFGGGLSDVDALFHDEQIDGPLPDRLRVVVLTLAGIAIGGGVTVGASASLLGGLMAAIGLSLFAGVVEELLARGALFRISEQHVGSLLALVITALIFGLQHADNPSATLASTLSVAIGGGLMLCAVYLLTRTLWATIAVHAAWNFGQSVLGIPVSGNIQTGVVQVRLDGPEWLTGGPFGIEPSVIALLLWTAVFAVALVLAVRAGRWQSWRAARTAVAEGRGSEPVGMQS